ncbi:MAG: hypothetical protein HOW73_35995 [Polyangiaceae bacterium]|nr:hypothetical protein [Polyangiaceae bacterium]
MDPELLALISSEIERRVASLKDDPSITNARGIAHALKGALGLAGAREASEACGRIERRISARDPRAVTDLEELLTRLDALIREGRGLPASTWPEPPLDLRVGPTPASHPPDYASAVHDRLLRIDAALAGARDLEAARVVFREVHTIKGAALSVGDEVMAWFCHGLEERLKVVSTEDAAPRALENVDTYRGVLAEIVDAPEHALETLRLMSGAPVSRPSRAPLQTPLPLPPRRPALEIPTESDPRSLGEAETVRVSTGVLDGLFERAGQLGQLRAPLSGGSTSLQRAAHAAREVQRGVREALRMIGPPRPWGAPAAAIARLEECANGLLPLADLVDNAAGQMTNLSRRLSREGETLSAAVQSLRTTFAASLLERLAHSAQSEASRAGKSVNVAIAGGDKPVDRRILDALVDPLRQLVRNAVAHGIETPEARRAAGKAPIGALRLSIGQRAGLLIVTVEDDGAGVDQADVRRRALGIGLISPAEAGALDERSALSLLFYPGFSTRADADLLAGRGVGLDLTLAAVQRLGGTIELESRRGQGLTATILVPAEASLVRVLWLECGGDVFGIPVQHVGSIVRAADWDRPSASLCKLLADAIDVTKVREDRLVVEIMAAPSSAPVALAVESVGSIEEVTLRALPLMVRAIGPFAAGIVWADDLRLSLDPLQLTRQAMRALA